MEAGSAQPRKVVPVRRFQGRINPVRAGLIAAMLVIVTTYLAFSKSLPWQDAFELKATFQSVNNIRLDSPVRIAGVEVGKVVKVEHKDGSNYGVVTMEIEENGLPIHEDATLKIRPRLFLEGNFFVDVTAGTPSSPTIDDGHTFPVTQTAYPVQLDQILTSLQEDTRKDLQLLLEGFGEGLVHEPTPGEDIGQDPDVEGESGAQALNESLAHTPEGLKNAARVQKAFLGTEPRDLRKLIAGLQKTAAALTQNEEQLKDFFTNFNRTMIALADEQANLRRAVGLLGPTIERANSYFANFAQALPTTREFVREFIPGVKETPATIAAAGPFFDQFIPLVGKAELGGLLDDLTPMTANFAKVVAESIGFYGETDLTSRCFDQVILPAGDAILQDGTATTGARVYKEFWYSLVGLAGQSANFDGNGLYTRVQTGGGANEAKSDVLPGRGPQDRQLFGNALVQPQGTRPTRPKSKPPYKPNTDCHKNRAPNMNGPAAKAGPGDN
jgi:ABC-type transporter Mla subunit MlaD